MHGTLNVKFGNEVSFPFILLQRHAKCCKLQRLTHGLVPCSQKHINRHYPTPLESSQISLYWSTTHFDISLLLGHRSGSCSMGFTDPNIVITFNPTHVAYPTYLSNQSWQYYVTTNYGVPPYLTFFTTNIRIGFGSLYKRPNGATNTLHSHHNSHDMTAI